ncbi:MAG: hypothetical protein R8G66_08660 [Cytophagales bacterium]|nr:hypothetical protein [Cytophagales bacterium]
MKTAGGFFVELIVVFIGVFSAFQLNDYRDRQRNDDVKINYYKSFQEELLFISKYNIGVRDSIAEIINYYETGIEKGARPALRYVTDFNMIGDAPIVQSAFSDEHFTSIGSYLLVNISFGNNHFGWLKERVDEYNRRVKDLLYNQNRSIYSYYDPSGQLKPEFMWYLKELKAIIVLINELERQIHEGAIPATNQLIESL